MTTPEPREDHDLAEPEFERWAEIRDDPKAIAKCGDRWQAVAQTIGCTLHGFNDGRSASFATPDGNVIDVGPKWRTAIMFLRRPSPIAESTPAAPEIATGAGVSVLGQSGPIDTAPIQIGTRCSQCGTAAPQAFAHECTRPVCAYRAALSTPTDATAVEAEREACAALAEDHIPTRTGSVADASARATARAIAAAIRARTTKES